MADTQFDVLTIGNAIVDVIAPITRDFLERENMAEGIMHLVDADRSAYLYDRMPPDKRQISGGSSANTAAGVASYGGRAAFVGKVAADDLGGIFADDLREIIAFEPEKKVTFFQVTGPREGAIINEIVEDTAGALHLRFYCLTGLRGKTPFGPEEQAEQAWMDSDKGYHTALLSTLKRTRELLAVGKL